MDKGCRFISLLFLGVTLCITASSCTFSRLPQRLYLSRTGDTLTVALDPEAQARWDVNRDSLVVECKGCAADRATVVEHFEDRDYARYEIAHTEGLSLTLYSMGQKDTVYVLSGTGTAAADQPPSTLRRLPSRRRRSSMAANTSDEEAPVTKHVKPKEIVKETSNLNSTSTTSTTSSASTTAAEKTEKKASMLKVTALEGVAVYKDKSKKEVLKILPQGTTLQLLSREGDLYSVAVGDGEGFVEAEAVQLQ